jgi:hypothetical protein
VLTEPKRLFAPLDRGKHEVLEPCVPEDLG